LKRLKNGGSFGNKNMAITIPKREDLKKSKQTNDKSKGSNIREVGLPEHLGGGRYLVSDKPGELILSPRSQSALPAIGTAERDHIISVALGGTSGRDNLQYLATTKEGRQEGKVSVEQKAVNDYVSGKINIHEARLLVATKQQQIKGLTPTEKEQTWQGQIGNVIKDAVKSIFKPFTKERREEAQKRGVLSQWEYEKRAEIASKALGENIKPDEYQERAKQFTTTEKDLIKAISYESSVERTAKVVTAPIRFTAGSLATSLVSYGLERADSEGKYTPKTDAEKLIIGEGDVQRLLKQEDIYGTIARGAGVPVALLSMAILESPFISGTGAGKLVKEALEKEMKKIGTEQLAKLGADEIIKMSNKIIRAEQKSGKLSAQQAEQAVKELSNIRVIEPKGEPKINIPERVVEPLELEAKKYKTADEFIKAQGEPVYHGTTHKWEGEFKGDSPVFITKDRKFAENVASEQTDNIINKFETETAPNGKSYYPTIKEFVINNDAKIFNINNKNDFAKLVNNLPDEFNITNHYVGGQHKITKNEWLSSIKNNKNNWELFEGDVIKEIKKLGYDGWEATEKGSNSIGLFNTDVIKTKPQLTDIWNKANKTTELKYEPLIAEPSIPTRIKNETIEKGIKADFKGIDEYDKISFKEQAKLVGDIIDEDPEKAIRIALGKELPTNGALPESVFMAVKNQAIKNGDADLLVRLATEEGGVAKESTILGQRIKMLDEQLEDDAFRNINKVAKARRAKLEKKGVSIPKAKNAEVNKIKSEITKAKPVKDEWLSFVDEITC